MSMELKIMSRFDEELSQIPANNSALEDEFNLDLSEENEQSIEKIKEMRLQLLESIGDDQPDPDNLLYVNIQRANELLDVVHHNIVNKGDSSARLFEVAAQLVNAITSAATAVQNSGFGFLKHEHNMRIAEIKEQEVAVKKIIAEGKSVSGGGSNSGGQVMVMSREEMLNMISTTNEEVVVPSAESEE